MKKLKITKMGKYKLTTCDVCKVLEGKYHIEGCMRERCPKCRKQILICNCKIKNSKREPFFYKVYRTCARCGKANCKLFKVNKKDWLRVVGKSYKPEGVLCEECFDTIAYLKRFGRIRKEKFKGGCLTKPYFGVLKKYKESEMHRFSKDWNYHKFLKYIGW